MQTSIVLVVAILVVSQALADNYPIYNDLLELNSNLGRPRRAPLSSCYDYNSCCDMSNAHKNDSMIPCLEKLKIQGRPNADQIKCIAECMAKTDGYMDENGKLDKDKMKMFLQKKLSVYSDWLDKTHIESVVHSCVENIDSSKQVASNECNDVAMTIGHCSAAKIQLYCPIEKQKDQTKCIALQNYITKNKNLPPRSERC